MAEINGGDPNHLLAEMILQVLVFFFGMCPKKDGSTVNVWGYGRVVGMCLYEYGWNDDDDDDDDDGLTFQQVSNNPECFAFVWERGKLATHSSMIKIGCSSFAHPKKRKKPNGYPERKPTYKW